ncbi:RNA exonuclease 1 homolog [Danaus plexippus]|uniref:RNA exonuclease 1 homolog n=1 Tax=Danaus plexippus TaxID=13037 RepID=UPI002AB11B37|nr:RNA exonuclease 1 homolog [Danaus plexippus]
MLPSTGYFKGINCPFYDSGICERPYCHFRHVKKETNNISGEGIESGNALLKLVSAAVQKVLQQTDSAAGSPSSNNTFETESVQCLPASSKVTYNPTPIAELNKINSEPEIGEEINEQKRRHIPVPYTPRKPASLCIKRPVDTNSSKLTYVAPVLYTPGSESAPDPYSPQGSTESNEKYLPGVEIAVQEYAPKETQNSNSKVNYIPSDKNVNRKKLLEYKPTKVKSQPSSVSYQPTPRSLVPCFSSDEDEPDTKKRKLSSDLNGLDELGPEFDILDQILDEEKSEKCSNNHKNDSSIECKENKKSLEVNSSHKEKDDKSHSKTDKINKEKSDKDKSEKKHDKVDKTKKKEKSEKSDQNGKDCKRRSSSTDKKSSHKSSNQDKKRHSSSESKSEKRSSSKSSSSSSKHSRNDSLRHSKHSSSDKTDSKKSKSNSSHHKTHKHSKESKDRKDKHKKHNSKSNSEDDDHKFENSIEDIEDVSEPDEEDIALECKRIFEEYVPSEKPEAKDEPNEPDISMTDNDEYIPSKKRVSRTTDKNIKVTPKAPIRPDFKLNAAQAMAERLAKVREFHAKITPDATPPASNSKPDSKPFVPPVTNHSKIRIAHVPYASTMLTAKKTIPPKPSSAPNNNPSTSCTVTQTVKKGTQRVAHLPSEKFIDRPGVLEPLGSKIPVNIRSTYLNLMIDNCLNIYLLPSDAYARAQNEELTTSKKCSSVPIYKNSAVLAISRLKKEVIECNGVKKSGNDSSGAKLVQGTVTNAASAGSWSIESKHKKNFEDSKQFVGANLYNNIKKWILTDEQLKENGFPRPHTNGEKGRAIIYGQNKQKPPKGFIRTCCRCKKEYTVDKKGFPVIKQDCIYHPNNKYRFRGEVKYQCCSQDESSDGCCIASTHVYEYVDFENLKGYVKTLAPDTLMDDYGVYSLDCEMCYTTQGLDLTRVTVINSSCKVVYETLIKPLHPIIDYNTRYSGITEEQMADVKTTLLDVQATLLTMFNSKTILIGHSLESDFKALKLIHDTVIDTSVLFPHKMGPPYKRALRNLSSEHLKKIIQNSVDGHDSAEDATVCMELLMYKVKEDLKTR